MIYTILRQTLINYFLIFPCRDTPWHDPTMVQRIQNVFGSDPEWVTCSEPDRRYTVSQL
jgi:hypothetical protein